MHATRRRGKRCHCNFAKFKFTHRVTISHVHCQLLIITGSLETNPRVVGCFTGVFWVCIRPFGCSLSLSAPLCLSSATARRRHCVMLQNSPDISFWLKTSSDHGCSARLMMVTAGWVWGEVGWSGERGYIQSLTVSVRS